MKTAPFTAHPVPIRRLGQVLSLALAFLLLGHLNPLHAQGFYWFSPVFNDATGVGNIANSSGDRSVAYDAFSNLVYVVNASTPSLYAYNATTGASLGAANVASVSGGTLGLDQVGVAADGAIYSLNLSTGAGSPNKIYRWSSWTATPTVAFSGYALTNAYGIAGLSSNARIGDTMTVTGSGTNTLILAAAGVSNQFCLFYTKDGVNFTNTIVDVPTGISPYTGYNFGLTFYTNNTFLLKCISGSSRVYLVQFPTNYASQNVVTGAVVTSALLGSSYVSSTVLSYSPAGGILAAMGTGASTTPFTLFAATNLATGLTTLVTNSLATPNSNGNATGGVALGGNGLTNNLYVLDTANSLLNDSISYSFAPLVNGPYGGITNAYPPQTLTLVVGGSSLTYQWYQISGGVTNPIADTTATYTANSSGTNLYFAIITNSYGSVTSSVAGLTLLSPVTNSAVSKLWTDPAGTYSFLTTGDDLRGLAFDAISQRLVVANSGSLYILNAVNGVYSSTTLATNGLSLGGQFNFDQVGIADDGVVYAGNLVTGTSQIYHLYRWSSPTNAATPSLAYTDSSLSVLKNAGDRYGDSMAVRGSGANTQIILGTYAGTNVAFLTTTDGTNFTANIIAVSTVSGFARNGISFGAGNTLWAKSSGGDLYEIAFDTNTWTGSVVFDYVKTTQIGSSVTGVAVDATRGVYAGVDLSDVNHDLKLYQLTGSSDSPVLFQQSFFGSANANGNANAAIVAKYPYLFALDVNNGLIGLTYGAPATTPASIVSAPTSLTVYTNDPSITFTVSASGSVPLYYAWQYSSASNGTFTTISGATSSSYTVPAGSYAAAGYYRAVVHNIGGYATSTPPALLTFQVPLTSLQVTNLWSVPANSASYPFLDSSTYNLRGLAYDTNSGCLLLADHTNIYVLMGNSNSPANSSGATNGQLLTSYNLATEGITGFGVNGWLVDQIGIADDGTLYSANLSGYGGNTNFAIVQWVSSGNGNWTPTYYAYGGIGTYATSGNGSDPGNGSGDRWGDTMDVRGSGTNTEIIVGSYAGTNVVIFDTTDGVNFSNHVIHVSATAGFSSSGIAFGLGNTFWAKGGHYYDLRQVAYDKTTGNSTVLNDFTAGTYVPNNLCGIAVDNTDNILGGVCLDDSPGDYQLYLISQNSNPPFLFDQAFFSSFAPNAQLNGASALKGGQGFALNVNNGLVAFNYAVPSAPSVTLTGVSYAPNNVTISWNNVFNTHSYSVYSATSLTGPWTLLGSVTGSAATASYTDTSSTTTTRFYRVVSQ